MPGRSGDLGRAIIFVCNRPIPPSVPNKSLARAFVRYNRFTGMRCGLGSSLTAAGLLADIVGVAFIGFAFLRNDTRVLLEQAKTVWDYSPTVLSALCEQKADNIIGIVFLL